MRLLHTGLASLTTATLYGICVGQAAAGGIVYSARYYYPPGATKTSHSHIYRIDPDGSHRRQLTSGSSEDERARWTPDGRHVAFIRAAPPDYTTKLCVMAASGGAVRVLGTDMSFDVEWQDDGHLLVHGETGSYRSYDIRTGTSTVRKEMPKAVASPDAKHSLRQVQAGVAIEDSTGHSTVIEAADSDNFDFSISSLIWLDNDDLICLNPPVVIDDKTDPRLADGTYTLLGVDGKTKARRHFQITKPGWGDYYPGYGYFRGLQPFRSAKGYFIAVENWHNSTVGTDWGYYKVEVSTGKTEFLREGQFLAWSPDGKRYCIAPGRDTTNYEKRPGGSWRTVWAAPLSVVDARTGIARQITPRLSYVTDADWRR